MILRKKFALAASTVALLGAAASSSATVIVGYGVNGSNVFAAPTKASDVSVAAFPSLAGTNLLKITSPTAATYEVGLGASLSDWTSSEVEALTGKSYVDLTTVTFNAGSLYSVDTLSVALRRPSSSGVPQDATTLTFALYIKVNGGANTDTATTDIVVAASSIVPTEQTFDLTHVTALQSIGSGSSVLFRLLAFSADTNDTTSDFGFSNISNLGTGTGFTGAIVVEGTSLSSIPEPSTYALIGGLGILCFVAYRRRRG
jgi:hypothetical protein